MNSSNFSEYDVQVGRILGAHALKGTVRVAPTTDVPDRHSTLKEVLVRTARAEQLLTIEKAAESSKGTWLVRFEGIKDRNQAEALAGGALFVREQDVPPLPEGRYYVHQIVGLRVVTLEGRDLGTLSEVLVTGANDVYVTEGGLIPATAEVVKEVDLEAGVMRIDPLPGMLDDEASGATSAETDDEG